jgi:hypothetical protein
MLSSVPLVLLSMAVLAATVALPARDVGPATDAGQDLVIGKDCSKDVADVVMRVEFEGPGGVPALVAGPNTLLSGTVTPAAHLTRLRIDGRRAQLETGTGRFRVNLPLDAGRQKLFFTADYEDAGVTCEGGTTEYVNVRDGTTLAAAEGQRWMLAMAVQNYDDPGLRDLGTPIADATEVTKVLREQYGFQSLLRDGDLVLEDPNLVAMGKALGEANRRIGPEDSLVIYYAGHGYANDTGAYWIPSDGGPLTDFGESVFSWFSGAHLQAFLKTTRAKHVLVLADSCFSSELTTRTPEHELLSRLENLDSERRQSLFKNASSRKSRVLIASGTNEPVIDDDPRPGRAGHSVFANALIDGLTHMPTRFDSFLSEHLFGDYISNAVGGNAAQRPVRDFFAKSGHDGGDLLFSRVGTR